MKIVGTTKFNNYLKKVDNLLDSTKFYARASLILKIAAKENFRLKEDSTGKKWKGIKRKGQILEKTGRLKSSITNAYDGKNAVAGTNLIYAPVHNFGWAKKNIAKREFMFLNKQGGINLEKMTIDFLQKL